MEPNWCNVYQYQRKGFQEQKEKMRVQFFSFLLLLLVCTYEPNFIKFVFLFDLCQNLAEVIRLAWKQKP